MALERTNLLSAQSAGGHGTGAFTPATYAITSGDQIVVTVLAFSNSNDALDGADLTISDSVGTSFGSPFIETLDTESPGWGQASAAWKATAGGSSGTCQLTIDAGAFNIHDYYVCVEKFTGHDATTLIGGKGKGTDADGDGAASVTLDATPSASSICYGFANMGQDSTVGSIDHGTGWTELYDAGTNGWVNFQAQYITGHTSTTVPWDDLSNGSVTPLGGQMIAYEVRAAAGGTAALSGSAVTSGTGTAAPGLSIGL
jgi:hypothetical protein